MVRRGLHFSLLGAFDVNIIYKTGICLDLVYKTKIFGKSVEFKASLPAKCSI